MSLELARAKGSCDGIVRVGGLASAGRRRTVSDLQPVSRRSRDGRCPGGSGWGEALASGRHLGNGAYAATRCAQVDAARRRTEAHRVKREAPAGIAGGPLIRDVPAGAGWKVLSRSARVVRERKHRRHPDSAVDAADGASTPSVQRELGKPTSARSSRDRRVRGCARGLF